MFLIYPATIALAVAGLTLYGVLPQPIAGIAIVTMVVAEIAAFALCARYNAAIEDCGKRCLQHIGQGIDNFLFERAARGIDPEEVDW